MIIFKFLLFFDIFQFKFLSRRGNEIYFFANKKVSFLRKFSKKLFDVEDYCNKFQYYFIEKMAKKLKKEFIFSKYLFLRSSLEEISREMTISNVLFHLFYCPRSIFAKNTCLRCSRLFVKKELEISFDFIEGFNFLSYFESEKIDFCEEFEFNVFFNDDQQRDVINSDVKRCLNSFVVRDRIQFLLLILEIYFRIFSNFFYSLSKDFSSERNERIFFLRVSFDYIKKFTLYVLYDINCIELQNLFEEVDFEQFHFLKVINKKYKEELNKKYAD